MKSPFSQRFLFHVYFYYFITKRFNFFPKPIRRREQIIGAFEEAERIATFTWWEKLYTVELTDGKCNIPQQQKTGMFIYCMYYVWAQIAHPSSRRNSLWTGFKLWCALFSAYIRIKPLRIHISCGYCIEYLYYSLVTVNSLKRPCGPVNNFYCFRWFAWMFHMDFMDFSWIFEKNDAPQYYQYYRISSNSGPIKKIFLQNLIIFA